MIKNCFISSSIFERIGILLNINFIDIWGGEINLASILFGLVYGNIWCMFIL